VSVVVQMQQPIGPRPSQPGRSVFDREVVQLKRRLVQEATLAIGMLQQAIEALWTLDRSAAAELKQRDETIDDEEVAIEQRCFELLALQQPVARDFRIIAFILRVNADVERVADHACSIAKIARQIEGAEPPRWPTALLELAERVPYMCQRLLRAVLEEDSDVARKVVEEDQIIDALDKQLFREVVEFMRREPGNEANGLCIARLGRELERIGDLMANIAEDVVYLVTGAIVRHEKNSSKANGGAKGPAQ
jgi:phosphate transport system protein